MGTRFRLVVYAADVDAGRAAMEAAMDRIQQLNDALSDYDPESELNQLCRRAPVEQKVSDDLWRVLRISLQVAEASEGRFDPTLGPWSQLWRQARRQRRLPDREALREAGQSVGYKLLGAAADRPQVRLERAGMQLDLGGVAKGFAADEALRILRERGFPAALVEGGGDMALGAPPPGKRGWRVAVAALEQDQPPSLVLEAAHVGLATSGDLWQFVELEGKRYSHVIDPATGLGVTRRSSVTVLAPSGALADAWASAGSVAAPETALQLWRRHGVEGVVAWLEDDAAPQAAARRATTAGIRRYEVKNSSTDAGKKGL